LYKMPCRVGIDRPEPTSCGFDDFAPLPDPTSSLFFGVKRFDLRRFFRDVVGVELGVGPSLLFSLSSLDEAKVLVSQDGTANLASEADPREAADPVDPRVPVLLDPMGGAVGGGTAMAPLRALTVANSSNCG
jgi:hypothetical protein